jgi:hypothetical protein
MDPSRFLLLFFCLSGSLSAQPAIEWQKSLGGSNTDQAEAICCLQNGGFLVAGNTRSTDGDVFGNHGGTDIWLVNLSSIGNVQWKKAYGGSGNDDVYSIQQTRDRGYVMAGKNLSNNWDVSGNHGDYDAWVVKLDSIGAIQWQRCFGGTGWEEAKSIKQTKDGGYVFAGFATSADGDVTQNQGSFDLWVLKLDSAGNIEWQRTYGGSDEDLGYSISPTLDGGYIVSGETQSNNGDVTGFHGAVDCWVLKLNFEGKVEWQKAMGGSAIDRTLEVLQTSDAAYIVLAEAYSINGEVTGNHGLRDYWVVKLTSTGSILWQKSIGGSNEDYPGSIIQTDDGGYVMTGETQSNDGDVVGNDGGADIWVVKIDGEGDLIWERTFGGTKAELGSSIQKTQDGGFIVAGYAWSNNGDVTGVKGKNDFWVIKLSPEASPTTSPISTPITIYPNPAKNTITLKLPTQEPNTLITINNLLLGRVISSQTTTTSLDGSVKMDVGTLPEGLYLVSAATSSGQVFFGKVLKQE